MTVNNEASSVSFTGNGVTTVFPYTFRIPEDDMGHVGILDIATSVLTELAPADYSIIGVGSAFGGSVTYNPLGVPLPNTQRIVIYRDLDLVQELDLTNQSPYFAETLEETLDRIVMMLQQVSDAAARSVKVTLGSTASPDALVAQLLAVQAAAAASAAAAQAAVVGNIGAAVTAAPNLASPANTDLIATVSGGLLRNTTWANVKAALLAYFATAFPRFDIATALTPVQQGQARANIGADILGGYRNKLINGDFDIWQRGNSVVNTSGSSYGPDRWFSALTAGITCTMTKTTVSASDNFTNYATFAFTGTGVAGSNIRQRIEGARTLANRVVTISGIIGDSVAQNYSVQLSQVFGTGGSPSATVTTVIGNIAVASGALSTNFSLIGTLPSTTGKTFGTNGDSYLELLFVCSTTNAHTLTIAHVSLVEGNATLEIDPFTPRHIQQELALCHRYFERLLNPVTSGLWYNTSLILTALNFKPKRIAPTPTTSATSNFLAILGGSSTVPVSIIFTSIGTDFVRVDTTTPAAGVAGHGGLMLGTNGAYIDISAEL